MTRPDGRESQDDGHATALFGTARFVCRKDEAEHFAGPLMQRLDKPAVPRQFTVRPEGLFESAPS